MKNHNSIGDTTDQQSVDNPWEKMANEANLSKEYSELLSLNPENLSDEERSRIVSFASELISNSFENNINPERLEKVSTNIKLLDRKQYRNETEAALGKEGAFMAILADGFYYDKTDSVYIRIPINMEKLISTTVHDSLHFVCDQTERSEGLNEGITELYTNRLIEKVGGKQNKEFYAEEKDFAKEIESIVSPEELETAYFSGDFTTVSKHFKDGDFVQLLKDSEAYFQSLDEVGEEEKQKEHYERMCSHLNKNKPMNLISKFKNIFNGKTVRST